jgi:hypothetical protein
MKLDSMKTDDPFDAITIHGDDTLIVEMNSLLQSGFYLKVPTQTSLRDILLYCGLSNELIDASIKTIFRNSQPVDDIDRTCISDGDVVGLSGSMPGLVGATLRAGSYLSAYRKNISLEAEEIPENQEEGFIRLKVFNVVLKEAGELFLNMGIYMKNAILSEFLKTRSNSFFDHCHTVIFNSTKVVFPPGNWSDLDFTTSMVFLTVKKA